MKKNLYYSYNFFFPFSKIFFSCFYNINKIINNLNRKNIKKIDQNIKKSNPILIIVDAMNN